MGIWYTLVNMDKREVIGFNHVDTGLKLRELSGTIIASNIVTYYLLTNPGDCIGFINNSEDRFIIWGQEYAYDSFTNFVDVTDRVIEELIKNEILKDNGVLWIDEEENLFNRDLVNIWDPKVAK